MAGTVPAGCVELLEPLVVLLPGVVVEAELLGLVDDDPLAEELGERDVEELLRLDVCWEMILIKASTVDTASPPWMALSSTHDEFDVSKVEATQPVVVEHRFAHPTASATVCGVPIGEPCTLSPTHSKYTSLFAATKTALLVQAAGRVSVTVVPDALTVVTLVDDVVVAVVVTPLFEGVVVALLDVVVPPPERLVLELLVVWPLVLEDVCLVLLDEPVDPRVAPLLAEVTVTLLDVEVVVPGVLREVPLEDVWPVWVDDPVALPDKEEEAVVGPVVTEVPVPVRELVEAPVGVLLVKELEVRPDTLVDAPLVIVEVCAPLREEVEERLIVVETLLRPVDG